MAAHGEVNRNRLIYAAAVVLVIAAGLASRRYPHLLPASLGKYPGDALWALMVFLSLGFMKPKWPSAVTAALALGISFSVEFSQLYQAPWIHSIRQTTLGHLVLGTTFGWLDLIAYGIGVFAGYLAEVGGSKMKNHRTLIALTVINLVLLAFTLVQQIRPALAADEAPMLRGSGLEIVDGQGKVRASIKVLPAGKSQAGETYPETVLLRLITERGRPSVKISTSEESSGLTVAGPTNTQDTYVILQAKGPVSSLKLRSEGGQEQILKP